MQAAIFSNDHYHAIVPLLDLALTETHSQGAYLYYFDYFDRPNATARLVAWSGPTPTVQTGKLEAHYAPIVLPDSAWSHPAFEALPEFRKSRFEGVVSIPLLHSGDVVGILNICRSQRGDLQPHELSYLLGLSVSIGAILAAAVRANLYREEASYAA